VTVRRRDGPLRLRAGASAAVWAAVSAAVLAIAVLACAGEERPPRVLLIGIDGASPRIIEPLLRAGRLPHLRRIAEAGTWEPLRSSFPLLSPRVWTTIATGKGDKKHGIHGWIKPVGEDGARLFYSSDRKGLALWNMLSSSGRSVAVVNWLVTYPPEIVDGVIVSDHAFPGQARGQATIGKLFAGRRDFDPPPTGAAAGAVVHPAAWTERVLAPEHVDRMPSSLPDPAAGDADFKYPDLVDGYRRFYATDQRIASVVLEIEAELRPDLLMVLFQGIDRISHNLWAGFEDPSEYPEGIRFSAAQVERARAAVEAYYEFTDDLVGLLVDRYSEDDLVLVLSDHGFEAMGKGRLTGGHTTPAALDGVIFARGRHVRAGPVGETLRIEDVAPTVLAWLGLPVARDMDGKPAGFLELEPAETIATWDTFEVERATGATSGSDEQILEQLEALGYVD
jgi:hypothetical protein